MGKGRHTLKRGRKQGNRHQKKRRTDEAGWDLDVEGKGRRGNWAHAERKNDMFVQYYRHAFGFSDELWAQFMDHLARDLPTTFRITGHAYFAPLIRDKLAAFFQPKLHNVDLGSELLPNVMQFEPLPWFPPPPNECCLARKGRINRRMGGWVLPQVSLRQWVVPA